MTEFGPHRIKIAETPSFGIEHLPTTDMQELWRQAGEAIAAERKEEPFNFALVDDIEESSQDELLTFAESLDSLADERVTLKRAYTPEGLAVKVASNLIAKPVRRIVSRREQTVLKTRAAIVAESLRTGLSPRKTIKGSDQLLAAALGTKENAKDDVLQLPIDTEKLYAEILEQHGLTPAESMKLAEGSFSGGEKRGRKLASTAALVAVLLLGNQLRQGDGTDDALAETSVAATDTSLATTTTTAAPLPTTTTTEAPAPTTTVAPTTIPPTTVPPVVYSQYQIGLGKRYSFRLNAEPLEEAAAGLTAKLGEQWDVATLQAYTGIEPGFVGTTAVKDCPDGTTVLIRSGETLDEIARAHALTMEDLKRLNQGLPRALAGICLQIKEE